MRYPLKLRCASSVLSWPPPENLEEAIFHLFNVLDVITSRYISEQTSFEKDITCHDVVTADFEHRININ